MAKKEKKKTPKITRVFRKAADCQHASFASQGATFAWKLMRWSMLLNGVLLLLITLAFFYGISKPDSYIAASNNINLMWLDPLKR